MKARRVVNLLVFLVPSTLIYTLFVMYPSISGLYYSLTDWDGLSPHYKIIGLDNFKEIFQDPLFYKVLKNSFLFAVFVVLIKNALALFFAIMLDKKMKMTGFFRSVYFIPAILSSIVVAYTWVTIFNPVFGSWQIFFQALGLDTIAKLDLLGNTSTSLPSVIFVSIWQNMGYAMVIYLAGLQTIPSDLYESAQIDGAGRWKQFVHITFPLIAPALTINMILSTINSLKEFDLVYILTGGGPFDSSQVIGTAIYKVAFEMNRFGYGIAMSLILFILIAVISLGQLRYLKKREVDY
ncbi:carbohydrate ABC transporter permease [Paenibacillus thalictri]|uniref:Sugar ABC transporter permease n=1 Tax=Paenibacillus thalictri TaxID=2527873 RepID=A0A4Q9DYZ2_9BACL|nr:sugar ABC transporter permease [Paenibacillus thalictri]TBL81128.1 sugar ABC transporter permease [Paenibacillus thalictri]